MKCIDPTQALSQTFSHNQKAEAIRRLGNSVAWKVERDLWNKIVVAGAEYQIYNKIWDEIND